MRCGPGPVVFVDHVGKLFGYPKVIGSRDLGMPLQPASFCPRHGNHQARGFSASRGEAGFFCYFSWPAKGKSLLILYDAPGIPQKIKQHNAACWLVNTGWTGGPYGAGKRISIKYTRALLNAALDGQLDNIEFVQEPFFCLSVPTSCPGVPPEILLTRNTWPDKAAYDAKAKHLAGLFAENFKQYKELISGSVYCAGPKG